MLSRVYIKPFDVNLSTNILIYNSIITSHWYLTACCWLCATMVALVFWIACTRRGCRCWHFHWCKVIKIREQPLIARFIGPTWGPPGSYGPQLGPMYRLHEPFYLGHHVQLKYEIENGNQGAHVTFVWIWRRSQQKLSFCRTFYPFTQHHRCRARTLTPGPLCHTS